MEFRGNEIVDGQQLMGYLSHNSDGWMLFAVDHRLVFQASDRDEVLRWAEGHRDRLSIG